LFDHFHELIFCAHMKRRLTAILAADVVGYSRLMGANETGTLTALDTLRTDFVNPKISEHQGRIVNLTGDGMLVEFPSVVSAVACATELQRGMRNRNAGVPQDHRHTSVTASLRTSSLTCQKSPDSWSSPATRCLPIKANP
jgi:class 3 adenylate cyclase